MSDLMVLADLLIFAVSAGGVGWVFGLFDCEMEVVWERGKAMPTARWITESGTTDGNALLAIDPDNVRLGRE